MRINIATSALFKTLLQAKVARKSQIAKRFDIF